ncbi:hypothetical protein BBI01_04840 [Chryseobacterium artocarpi]|uniref:Uncharacterized protein n=1 Tax=Chryseobacterium artocarpi TaxID=1414727 RepID=A0A1B8ZWQ8_9FLAO|nr:hypothetical protein BBI01_04840 [Chryseobacterium artocarpi]
MNIYLTYYPAFAILPVSLNDSFFTKFWSKTTACNIFQFSIFLKNTILNSLKNNHILMKIN